MYDRVGSAHLCYNKCMDILKRFTIKYEISESGCHNWQAATLKNGYGLFWNGKKNQLAHRWSYEFHKGAIPLGLVIDHLCKNTLCVNPEHLEAVTQQTNFLRGGAVSKCLARTCCKHGHEYTLTNTVYVTGVRGRICRTCRNSWHKEYKRTKRANDKLLLTAGA